MTDKEKLQKIVSNPILWIETFVKIVDKDKNIVPFKLNPQQRELMENWQKYNIVLKSRQVGITSVSLAYSLYLCSTKPNRNCMIMSYKDDAAREVFEKLKMLYNYLPDCVKVETITNNRKELKFVNGSKIVCNTCSNRDNARGSTLDFVHLSEVGLMKSDALDNQMTAILQALVPSGTMTLESTAKGLNKFFDLWQAATSGESPMWKPFFFPWHEDKKMFATEYKQFKKVYRSIYGKYLDESEFDEYEFDLYERGASIDQLMWRRLKISQDGLEKFKQEFPSNPIEAFLTTGSNVFSPENIQERLSGLSKVTTMKLPDNGSIDPILKKYKNYLNIYKQPIISKDSKYYIGVDTGEGLGGSNDYSVICVLDKDGFQCAEWRSNRVKPYEFTEVVYNLAKYYNSGLLVIEKASAGHTVLDRINNDKHYINIYKHRAYDQKRGKQRRQIGYNTDSKTKPMMIADMQEWFETGKCLVNSSDLLSEMKYFEFRDNKMQAARSGHDDTVMAFAMAIQGLKSGQYFYQFGKK